MWALLQTTATHYISDLEIKDLPPHPPCRGLLHPLVGGDRQWEEKDGRRMAFRTCCEWISHSSPCDSRWPIWKSCGSNHSQRPTACAGGLLRALMFMGCFPTQTISRKKDVWKGSPLPTNPSADKTEEKMKEGNEMRLRSKSDKSQLDLSNKNKWFFYQNNFFIVIGIGGRDYTKERLYKSSNFYLELLYSLSLYKTPCTFEENSYNFLSLFSASWREQPVTELVHFPLAPGPFF